SGRNHQSAAVPLCLTLYSQIDASFRMVDVDQLRVQLAKLDDQLVQWSLADDSIFERERQAGTPADEIMKMILNDRRERVIAGVPGPNDELLKLLDHIMDEYLRADETTRGAIRGAFNGKDRVL